MRSTPGANRTGEGTSGAKCRLGHVLINAQDLPRGCRRDGQTSSKNCSLTCVKYITHRNGGTALALDMLFHHLSGGQPPSPLLGARRITASNQNSLVLRDNSKLCHIAIIGRLRVRSTLKTRGSRYDIDKLDPFIGSVSSPDFIHERGGSNPVGGAQPLRRSHSEACTADPSIRVATRMLFCCECLLQRN